MQRHDRQVQEVLERLKEAEESVQKAKPDHGC